MILFILAALQLLAKPIESDRHKDIEAFTPEIKDQGVETAFATVAPNGLKLRGVRSTHINTDADAFEGKENAFSGAKPHGLKLHAGQSPLINSDIEAGIDDMFVGKGEYTAASNTALKFAANRSPLFDNDIHYDGDVCGTQSNEMRFAAAKNNELKQRSRSAQFYRNFESENYDKSGVSTPHNTGGKLSTSRSAQFCRELTQSDAGSNGDSWQRPGSCSALFYTGIEGTEWDDPEIKTEEEGSGFGSGSDLSMQRGSEIAFTKKGYPQPDLQPCFGSAEHAEKYARESKTFANRGEPYNYVRNSCCSIYMVDDSCGRIFRSEWRTHVSVAAGRFLLNSGTTLLCPLCCCLCFGPCQAIIPHIWSCVGNAVCAPLTICPRRPKQDLL